MCYHKIMKEKIDLTPFRKALDSFDEILKRYEFEFNDSAIRDAVIQRFEYTYSLSFSMIERFLKRFSKTDDELLTFNETIRKANKYGLLLNNLEKWAIYRENFNIDLKSSQEDRAAKIIKFANNFQKDAHFLFKKIVKAQMVRI